MDAHTSCNILLSHPSLNALGAIESTPHLAMKFPLDVGTITIVHADQRTARECYMASLRLRPHKREGTLEVVHCVEDGTEAEEVGGLELDPRTNDDNRVTLVEETTTFDLGPREG